MSGALSLVTERSESFKYSLTAFLIILYIRSFNLVYSVWWSGSSCGSCDRKRFQAEPSTSDWNALCPPYTGRFIYLRNQALSSDSGR